MNVFPSALKNDEYYSLQHTCKAISSTHPISNVTKVYIPSRILCNISARTRYFISSPETAFIKHRNRFVFHNIMVIIFGHKIICSSIDKLLLISVIPFFPNANGNCYDIIILPWVMLSELRSSKFPTKCYVI